MLNLFKQNKPKDIKALRSDILDIIKEQLKKAESGEGGNIKGLHLYVTSDPQDKFLYEGALYTDDENKFKDEVQKIADDFAINLPENWSMQILFEEAVPSEAIKSSALDIALFISTKQKPAAHKEATAYIKVLSGEAEHKLYEIHSSNKKINIGRENNVRVADGYFRQNQIAFPDNSNDKSNRSVSRQHAHIEWSDEFAAFFLFADEGGIPPANKIKVKPEHGQEIKLMTTEIGHQLKEGDQIILGESALLEFSYSY
ncbi:MAG: FHA domain-containing protein [Parafilimonas sp.]|nr:FHA domain-containing protein [Parafilimonas sp.]